MADKVLTEEDVRLIYKALKDGEPQGMLAREFGVTQQSISAINNGAAWSAVTGEIHKPSRRSQLTVEDVRTIDQALRAGGSAAALAKDYSVSEETISNIKRGRNWTWVTGRPLIKRRNVNT